MKVNFVFSPLIHDSIPDKAWDKCSLSLVFEYVLQISPLTHQDKNLSRIPDDTISYQYDIVQWSLLNYNHYNLSRTPFISFKGSLRESISGHFEDMWAFCAQEVDYELTNLFQLIIKSIFNGQFTQLRQEYYYWINLLPNKDYTKYYINIVSFHTLTAPESWG